MLVVFIKVLPPISSFLDDVEIAFPAGFAPSSFMALRLRVTVQSSYISAMKLHAVAGSHTSQIQRSIVPELWQCARSRPSILHHPSQSTRSSYNLRLLLLSLSSSSSTLLNFLPFALVTLLSSSTVLRGVVTSLDATLSTFPTPSTCPS